MRAEQIAEVIANSGIGHTLRIVRRVGNSNARVVIVDTLTTADRDRLAESLRFMALPVEVVRFAHIYGNRPDVRLVISEEV